jgi:hypothetical protein
MNQIYVEKIIMNDVLEEMMKMNSHNLGSPMNEIDIEINSTNVTDWVAL